MILEVPFEQFVATVNRVLKLRDVYVMARGAQVVTSAASAVLDTIVISCLSGSAESARAKLTELGCEVHDGMWRSDDAGIVGQTSTPYIAAVAYVSHERTPGIWIDAYPSTPTHALVLKNLYEEFRETGQMPEVSFEEFVNLAHPNVVTVSPDELTQFASEKELS